MSELIIPSHFDNFQQRESKSGFTETTSETDYKGYVIKLRAYTCSGISFKIFKMVGDKRISLRQETWSFYDPLKLLQKAKTYIDNYSDKLDEKIQKK